MAHKPRQRTLRGIIPPLSLAQERALEYLEKKAVARVATQKAKDAEEDMVAAARKLGVDVIKVRDDRNKLHVWSLDNKIGIKHQVLTDIKIEKLEKEAAGAAGAGGPKA